MSGENTSKVRLMTVWATCQDVRRYALIKWDSLNYATNTPFASENDFDQFLSGTLIPRAQAHINAFCRRDFDLDYLSGVPEAVKDVAARATANMVQYLVMNKMGPLIQTGDFKLKIPTQAVLTDELKALLMPWVKRTPRATSTPYKTREIQDTWDYPQKDPFLL